MRKIFIATLLFLSANSFAQTQLSSKDVDMILDTNYIFFVYKDKMYSSEGPSFNFPKFVSICRYLRYDSDLPPEQANNAFSYMMNWWFFRCK